MTFDKLDTIIEENETFVGADLDTEKMERLDAMRALCEKIGAAEPRITTTPLPVLDTHRHGGVRLELPSLIFTANKEAIHALGEIFRLSDSVTVIVKDGETVRITCDVHNIWKTNINKPGHNVWHVKAVYSKNQSFVYKFTVHADTEELARIEANKQLPAGYAVSSITKRD